MIATELGLEPSAGKDLLLKGVGGKTLPPDLCKDPFLSRVRRVGFFLRWLACSTLPELHDQFPQSPNAADEVPDAPSGTGPGRRWPEASVLAIWWQRAEDTFSAPGKRGS